MPYYKKIRNHLDLDNYSDSQRRLRQARLSILGPDVIKRLRDGYEKVAQAEADFLYELAEWESIEQDYMDIQKKVFAHDMEIERQSDAIFDDITKKVPNLPLDTMTQSEVYHAIVPKGSLINKVRFGRLMRMAGYERYPRRVGDKVHQSWR